MSPRRAACEFLFLGEFFDFFLVTAITSVEGTFHSVFFFFLKAPAFDSLCRCHCHLQCCDTQLDPISVRGLSQYFSSSSLLFVFIWLSAY